MPVSLYNHLIQERADLNAESARIAAAAASDGRRFTDEERTRLDAIERELDVLATDIARAERLRERERQATPVPLPQEAASRPDGLPAGGGDAPRPFRSFGQQLLAVADAARSGGRNVHAGLTQIEHFSAAASGANETVGADGGFLVQQDFSNELLLMARQTGVLYPLTTRRPVGPNSNGVRFNLIDETSRASGSRWGGVRGYWVAEAGTLTPSRPKFRQVNMTLEKLIGLYYATDEELADAVQLTAVAQQAFAEEFGFMIDDAIIRGSGAGVPLGILNAAYLGRVSISKETDQVADTILAENIEKMYAAMPAADLGSAEWYINQECWPQIFQLHHTIGLGGVPMFVPPGGLNAAPFGTLLGRPIRPIEQASALGDEGDIIFAAMRRYLTIEKGGIESASSIHVQFLTDETVFRFTLRMNGQPMNAAPLTPYKGAQQQSPFVTLAARA